MQYRSYQKSKRKRQQEIYDDEKKEQITNWNLHFVTKLFIRMNSV